MSRVTKTGIRTANFIGGLCVAIPLLAAFRLWSFAYFWVDDFGNLYWIQPETAARIIQYAVDPRSTFFRPVGMLFYEILYRSAGLDPWPYHLVAWSLHAINTFLLFLILRRLLRSSFGAVAGAIPFALRVNFADIYWSFGTIFELLACCLMFSGMYIYIRYKPSWPLMVGLSGLYILAIKSKEMAITLLAIWILYDWCVRRRLFVAPLALPLVAGGWFTLLKVRTMRGVSPLDPYYIDWHLRTVVGGFGQYFSWLYGLKLPAVVWCLCLAVSLLMAVYLRNRLLVFFLSYTSIAFAPVIFLVNHRWPYFWYIPFFGIAGLFGLAATYVRAWISERVSRQRLIFVNALLLMLWAGAHSGLEYMRSARTRATQAAISADFRSFVDGLTRLGTPEPGATLYFTAIPSHFNAEILNAAVQVSLKRPDLHGVVVTEFPQEAQWRLAFANGVLRRYDH